jgi:hypothetical protein
MGKYFISLIMKNVLFLLSIAFSSPSFAKDSCSFTWQLQSSGVSVGKTTDVISKNNNILEVKSSSTPSAIAEIFNVKKVIRTVVFKDKNLISRVEEAQGRNNKIISWNQNNEGMWVQNVNGEIKDKTDAKSNYISIDSTSLPYLLYLNILPSNTTEHKIVVINKSMPYHAKVLVELINDDPIKKYKVSFKTNKSTGMVYLDANKKPLEMSFDDSKISFNGNVIAHTCD